MKVRGRFRLLYDILKGVEEGKNTKSRIFYSKGFCYNQLTPLLGILMKEKLIDNRDATEEELRRDGRSKWFIELTEEGRRFLREVEALDRKYSGILLGE